MVCSNCLRDVKECIWECKLSGCDARLCGVECAIAHDKRKNVHGRYDKQGKLTAVVSNTPRRPAPVPVLTPLPEVDERLAAFNWDRALDLDYLSQFAKTWAL